MPIVPLNTITGPSGARLPKVDVASPNMAEAFGDVAHAASRQASQAGGFAQNAGRAIGIIGQGIDAERDRLRSQQEIIGADMAGKNAMWNGITNLAGEGIDAAFKLERIYEIRDSREADDAVAEYSNFATTTLYGKINPDGTRTLGAMDAPYVPSGTGEEQSGATIAFSKAEKEFLENNPKLKNLSPRARDLFTKRIMDPRDTFLRQTWKQDKENHGKYREIQNVAYESAEINRLASIQDDAEFLLELPKSAQNIGRRDTESYRSNPEETDPEKMVWNVGNAPLLAEYSENEFAAKAIATRVNTIQAKAANAATPEEAQTILAQAEAVANYTQPGANTPVLPELLREQTKAKNADIAQAIVQRNANIAKQNNDTALNLSTDWLIHGNAESKQKLDELRPSISPTVMAEIDKTAESLHYKREMADLDEAKASYVASIGTPNQQAMYDNMHLTAQGMSNQRAKIQAPAFMAATSKEVTTASQNATADYLEKVIYFGGEPGPDGTFRSYSDAKLTTMLSNADVPFSRAKSLAEEISKRKDRDPIIEQKVYETIDRLIGSDIDQAFKLQDGVFEYETRTEKGKTVPTTEADATLGELKTGDMRWRGGFTPGGWKEKDRTVKLKAELVRNVAQDAYDWYRQQKVLSKPGPQGQRAEPADVEAYIRNRLMPENNEDARAWTEADIEARIQIGKDEREQMRLLILEQFSASQMTQPALH